MYTTTDIGRCLGIKRERLKIWMSNGYIRPSKNADGPGSKYLLSIFDRYLLKLFQSLVERGFPRRENAHWIDLIRASLYPTGATHVALSTFIRKGGDNKKSSHPEILMAEDADGFTGDANILADGFLKHYCHDRLITNFKKVRKEVDAALRTLILLQPATP